MLHTGDPQPINEVIRSASFLPSTEGIAGPKRSALGTVLPASTLKAQKHRFPQRHYKSAIAQGNVEMGNSTHLWL